MARLVSRFGPGLVQKSQNFETIIEKEIKDLDPDKYLGTIGLTPDAPKNAVRPHYTTFPPNSEEGNWLRVVSETIIDGKALLIGQEWLCVTTKTESKAAVWELIQQGEAVPAYPTTRRQIGQAKRYLDTTALGTATPNSFYFPPLQSPVVEGCFDNSQTRSPTATLLPFSNLIVNQIEFDFYLRVEFSNDSAGQRSCGIIIYIYQPSATNPHDLLITSFPVDSRISAPGAPILIWRVKVRVPRTDPLLPDVPLTYSASAWVRSTSDVPVNVTFVELTIAAFGR